MTRLSPAPAKRARWPWAIVALVIAALFGSAIYRELWSPLKLWERCHATQTKMLRECTPGCNETDLVGQAYDGCLDECAVEQFGEPVPLCGAKPE